MEDASEPKTYMATRPCGHWVCVIVNQPERAKEVGKEVGSWIKAGLKVDLVETADIRSGKYEMCDCPRPKKSK